MLNLEIGKLAVCTNPNPECFIGIINLTKGKEYLVKGFKKLFEDNTYIGLNQVLIEDDSGEESWYFQGHFRVEEEYHFSKSQT